MDPLRRLQLSLLALVGLLFAGTAGYMLLEQMSVVDALYLTVITLATVGYSEVRPQGLDAAGRLFTISLIVSGVLVFASALRNAAELALGDELRHRMEKRRMQRAIDELRDHYIICGYGRVGQAIVHELQQRDVPLVVVESDPAAVRHLQTNRFLFVEGDATRDDVLQSAGVERARGLLAVISSDGGNVLIVLTARTLNPKVEIIARAGQRDMEDKLRRAGANAVLSPYEIGGRRMALAAIRPAVNEFLETVVHSREMRTDMDEVRLHAGAPLVGLTVASANLREKWGAVIVAIKRPNGSFEISPRPDRILEEGDCLLIVAESENLRALAELGAGQPKSNKLRRTAG